MSGNYRLFGAESSAYSTKIRSFLRYKGVAFDWTPRTAETEADLQAASRFSTLPVLVTASGYAVHDTTPMMEALDADSPDPTITPEDPALAFLTSVLEEYADTWLAKAAYQFRWSRKKDQKLAAQRAIDEYYGENAPENRKELEAAAIERMSAELKAVGLDGELGGQVEKSFKKFLKALNDHLRKHLYLFGGTPTMADFAIGGQLIQMMKDPTPARMIEKDAEFVAKWCEFLDDPKAGGPFESLEELAPTLAPLFEQDLSAFFLPWAAENLESSLAGSDTFEVTLNKETLTLAPLRSAARSFRELRRKFVKAQEVEALKAFTDAAGATQFLLRPQALAKAVEPEAGEGEGSGEQETAADASGSSRRRRRRRKPRSDAASAEAVADQSAAEAGEESEAEASPPEGEAAEVEQAAEPGQAADEPAASEPVAGQLEADTAVESVAPEAADAGPEADETVAAAEAGADEGAPEAVAEESAAEDPEKNA